MAENIYLTGSVNALANWSPDNALLLSSANYPTWNSESYMIRSLYTDSNYAYILLVTVNLSASTSVQYKYIRKYNGAVTWESDPNNMFTTPASGSLTLNDSWR